MLIKGIRKKIYSTQEQREMMQPVSEKQRQDYMKVYGNVPPSGDPERDKWEAEKRGIIHKKV